MYRVYLIQIILILRLFVKHFIFIHLLIVNLLSQPQFLKNKEELFVPDYDTDPVTWISLASLAGLSLVSLGQPGLKSGLDEQVYTGGLTAVQQILGGEIGGDTTRFVGGSDKHKTGRFLVKSSSSELIGQFLLISPRNLPVAPALIEYYEHLVTFFAEETLKTDLVEKAEKMYSAFGVSDIIPFFLSSIKKARKKVSIPQKLPQLFFSHL